jgi:tartrate dehydrogenase/decarboxylase / D-malate dehydrogenase
MTGSGEAGQSGRGVNESSSRGHRIAVIRGDGVGPEVVDAAISVLEATSLPLDWQTLDWGSDYFHSHGRMAPEDALDIARTFDAIFLGAVGDPSIPDHITLWGLLLPLRQGLDLWANQRPVRLLGGVEGKLAGVGPEEIDMLFVRENTEGEYSGVGGRAHQGLSSEVGIEAGVFTRGAVERVARHAFELAAGRNGSLVSATKSNASRYGYVLWDEVVEEVASEFPHVRCERVLVDALAARMVTAPGSLDVVVASNLFGDVLTDLGAAIQGGMGMAASSSTRPGEGGVGIFEPVHGSAPDIAGKGLANPAGSIWSAALMLKHLGEADAATAVMRALEAALSSDVKTHDLGGTASTEEFAASVAAEVPRQLSKAN